jgi:hypothetical protein
MACKQLTIQEYRELVAKRPNAKSFETFEECDRCDNCMPDCLCSGEPNYAANNFPSIAGHADGPGITQTEQCSATLFAISAAEIEQYYGYAGPRDACGLACAGLVDDLDKYYQCQDEVQRDRLRGFEWKPCYPGLLEGRQLYMYTEWNAMYWFSQTARDNSAGEFLRAGQNSASAFYLCDGEKLVDVTDKILTKSTYKRCESKMVGVAGTNDFTNTQNNVDMSNIFNGDAPYCQYFSFTPNPGGGRIFESGIKYGTACELDWKTACSAYKNPQAKLKDANMTGCPQTFMENPLP